MLGVVSHHQPLDFTMTSKSHHTMETAVLDLRKVKVEHYEEGDVADSRSSVSLSPHRPCFPAGGILGQHLMTPVHDSSEEGSDMSVSPPLGVLTPSMYTQNMISAQRSRKPTRPFKAYPKDPLSLTVGVSTAEAILGQASNEAYVEFRRRMLAQVQAANSPISNAKMKRSVSPQHPTSSGDDSNKDSAYWERRRKNNEAAKRSRDARRAKEDEIAIRAAFLEQENLKLKYETATLRNEVTKLRCLLYNTS